MSTILKNLIYMFFSNFVIRIGSLITIIYLAQKLGPDDFGKINFASTFITYFSVIADFSLGVLASKEISQNKENINKIINETLSLKILFSIFSFSLLFISLFFIDKSFQDKKLIFLYALTIFSSSTFFLIWFFQAIEKMKFLGYSLILQSFFYVTFILLFIKNTKDIFLIPVFLLFSQFLAVIFHFYNLKKLIPDYKFKFSFTNLSIIKKSFPITLNSFLSILSQSTPLILIGFYLTDSSVGFFSSSQKISILIWEIICNYLGVIFPVLSRSFKNDKDKMNKIINYSIKFSFVFLMPILVFIAIFSYSITEFIYGNKFIESYWTLKILIFIPILMFLDSLFYNFLLIAEKQKVSFFIKLFTTLLMILLIFIFIKPFGINMVALIIAFSFLLNFLIEYFYSKKFIKLDFLNSIIKPIFFSVLAGAIAFYIKETNLNLAFFFSISFYFISIYLFKTFDKEEINFMKNNIKSIKAKFLEIKIDN